MSRNPALLSKEIWMRNKRPWNFWKNGLQHDFYIWDTNHEYSTTLIMQCIYDSEVVGNKFEINGIRWLKKKQRNLVPHFFGKQTAAFIIS